MSRLCSSKKCQSSGYVLLSKNPKHLQPWCTLILFTNKLDDVLSNYFRKVNWLDIAYSCAIKIKKITDRFDDDITVYLNSGIKFESILNIVKDTDKIDHLIKTYLESKDEYSDKNGKFINNNYHHVFEIMKHTEKFDLESIFFRTEPAHYTTERLRTMHRTIAPNHAPNHKRAPNHALKYFLFCPKYSFIYKMARCMVRCVVR